MSLEEAIEILTLMGTPEFEGHTEDILAARQLGIENMKATLAWRVDWQADRFHLLPGETVK